MPQRKHQRRLQLCIGGNVAVSIGVMMTFKFTPTALADAYYIMALLPPHTFHRIVTVVTCWQLDDIVWRRDVATSSST